MLPVAWRLLRIRTAARIQPDRPGSDLLTTVQLKVLAATSKRVALPAAPSVSQVLLAIAGLGGHLKRNGQPGWITLGRGFDTLLAYEIGYRAALQAEDVISHETEGIPSVARLATKPKPFVIP